MPDFKLRLDDFEVGSDEMLAVAIHAPGLASYTLAHFLNKKMSWNLINIKKPYRPPENPLCLLEVYNQEDEINRVQYLLTDNHFQQQYWIPKMPDVDYWVIMTGAGLSFSDTDDILRLFSETESVFSAALLPFDSISGNGKISPLFKYFQSFYNEMDDRGIIQHFE